MSALPYQSRRGFTLVEMLTAMAIFVIMIAFLGQLISNTSTATNASKGKLNADDQARFALDRIGEDLQRLAKRTDLDYQIAKKGGNDEFYFYSEVSGLGATDAKKQSGMSLVGYRIDPNKNKLERYSESFNWDDLTFLSYGADGKVIANTTLKQKVDGLDAKKYHVLCDGVFRLEIQFLLRDGTYSDKTHLENGSKLLGTNGVPAGEVNSRQDPQDAESPEICIAKDAGGNPVWRGLGWQDVSAVIVTLAVIDDGGRRILSDSGVGGLVGDFSDSNPATDLPAKVWQQSINSGNGFSGLPKKAVSGLRIYQRTFYLSTL